MQFSDLVLAESEFGQDLIGVLAEHRRRRDNLAGKKVVVWVFRASEFSETDEGWRVIPVIR